MNYAEILQCSVYKLHVAETLSSVKTAVKVEVRWVENEQQCHWRIRYRKDENFYAIIENQLSNMEFIGFSISLESKLFSNCLNHQI